ncbi:hypothetical protein PSP6_320202 [Paraburkholderia tropica]|nr:hypothetical protein PSP6_320202 [Paraburkholderia tropica]
MRPRRTRDFSAWDRQKSATKKRQMKRQKLQQVRRDRCCVADGTVEKRASASWQQSNRCSRCMSRATQTTRNPCAVTSANARNVTRACAKLGLLNTHAHNHPHNPHACVQTATTRRAVLFRYPSCGATCR